MPTESARIEVDGVSRWYASTLAVDAVSFEVRAGAVRNALTRNVFDVEPEVAKLLVPRAQDFADGAAGSPWEAWLRR